MTTIKLEGKEYQIDIEQAKKLNLLKEKDNRVKSWEEFTEKYYHRSGYCYLSNKKKVESEKMPLYTDDQLTSHEAVAINAFSKLLKLRRDWIGDWEPDWDILEERKYVIENMRHSQFEVIVHFTQSHALSFPSYELAQEFLETFRDLIEDAKILI